MGIQNKLRKMLKLQVKRSERQLKCTGESPVKLSYNGCSSAEEIFVVEGLSGP